MSRGYGRAARTAEAGEAHTHEREKKKGGGLLAPRNDPGKGKEEQRRESRRG